MRITLLLLITLLLTNCETRDKDQMKRIIFLHHSTGGKIWVGSTNRYIHKLTKKSDVPSYFRKHNRKHGTDYSIVERNFPAESPYGWKNGPYDYYNIWVKNAGNEPYMNEPTLEMLTPQYDVIIFKHCFPYSRIKEDTGQPDINSNEKTIENYKLQYNALKSKMHEFSNNKFIVWTPAVHVSNNLYQEEAKRANDFYNWIVNEWDDKGDNIFLFDFYQYETEGGLYLQDKYAAGPKDSHPNKQFSGRIAPLFASFVIDVVEGKVE